MPRCQLCGREVGKLTSHHLIPKSRQGKKGPRVELCSACHRMVHRTFPNRELAAHYHCLDNLKAHPEIRKFIRWVRKQDPNKRIKVR